MGEEVPFKVEYAKTGRSRCRFCDEKIELRVLRLALKLSKNATSLWYHKDCFFKGYKLKTLGDIDGLDSLKPEDQQIIKDCVKNSVEGPAAVTLESPGLKETVEQQPDVVKVLENAAPEIIYLIFETLPPDGQEVPVVMETQEVETDAGLEVATPEAPAAIDKEEKQVLVEDDPNIVSVEVETSKSSPAKEARKVEEQPILVEDDDDDELGYVNLTVDGRTPEKKARKENSDIVYVSTVKKSSSSAPFAQRQAPTYYADDEEEEDSDDSIDNYMYETGHGTYECEYAKSGRSHCVACHQKIAVHSVRIAKMDYEAGSHFRGAIPRWHHVNCFAQCRKLYRFRHQIEQIPGFRALAKEDRKMVKRSFPPAKKGRR